MAPSKSNQSAAQKREAFFGSINKEKVRECEDARESGGGRGREQGSGERCGRPRALWHR